MSTAKLRIRAGIFEVEGYHLPPMKGFGFLVPFVHRKLLSIVDGSMQYDNEAWNVSDLHTGCGMSPIYHTRREAAEGIAGYLADKGRKIVRRDFNKMLKKFGDLLADKREPITETFNKEKDMKLTKTDDKFDDSTGVAKSKKATSRKTVTSSKPTEHLKTLSEKAAKQIAKRTSTVKHAPKGEKRCARCKKILPLTDFHKKTKSPDGKLSHCKVCECAYQKKRREAGPNIPEKSAKAISKAVETKRTRSAKPKKTAKLRNNNDPAALAPKASEIKKIKAVKKTAKKAVKKATKKTTQ